MPSSHTPRRSLTTSSSPPAKEPYSGSRPRLPPRPRRPQTPPKRASSPASPAWSTASTADAGPSPSLPAIPAPHLPERIAALLRTPSPVRQQDDDDRFITASWGSPYPESDTSHLRLSSLSSEPSDGSPIHQITLHTPFLRPAPEFLERDQRLDQLDDDDDDDSLSLPSFSLQANSSLVSATVLANRARRPARGLTEDWIRQHTTGDFGSEARLWLSDSSSAGGSESSSLSGSVSGDDNKVNNTAADETENRGRKPKQSKKNVEDRALRTPRATLLNRQHTPRPPADQISSSQEFSDQLSVHQPRYQSSLETLRGSDLKRRDQSTHSTATVVMASSFTSNGPEQATSTGSMPELPVVSASAAASTLAERPSTPTTKLAAINTLPATPTPQQKTSPSSKREPNGNALLDPVGGGELAVAKAAASPRKTPRRVKKKLPWKGKSILVLLPIDENRGQPGKAPMPLSQTAVDNMLHSWEELGYNTKGFDLGHGASDSDFDQNNASRQTMSRPSWPDEGDVARERAQQNYPIQLPDLNAWANYVQELNEAKLRALGVSFGDDEPPLPPSITPSAAVAASISRQNSVPIYPPLPFSPPVPTGSASSNMHGAQQFAFPGAFMPGTGGISPSMPSAASPLPFGVNHRFNNRQSISIPASHYQMSPMQTTPGGFSPQALLLQNGLARGGSPSLAALSSVMSPSSPFTPDRSFASPPLHQRHQSLQYPMMQYPQLQTSSRASPRLQNLHEIEEDVEEKPAPSTTPAKSPEPAASQQFTQQHNANFSLQKDIDAAEYHLEEQFREQFEHDRDYSPHGGKDAADGFDVNGNNTKPPLSQHARGLSVQFANNSAPIQRFRGDTADGPLPLHHPRPHSRGHSLANAYFEPEAAKAAAAAGIAAAQSGIVPGNDSYEVVTNPSSLGTPVQQGLDFVSVLQNQQKQDHQRSFSTASNPWGEDAGMSGNKRSSLRKISHGSKASMSNLNVDAPEFKFNPGAASTFQPSFASSIGSNPNANGSYLFGAAAAPNPVSEPFQPSLSIFQAGLGPNAPPSASTSQFSFPTSTTGNNPKAPTLSPGQSEFSFASMGPKFRPDAPVFKPLHSVTDSLTSPIMSGTESANGSIRPASSIFGNIDIAIPSVGQKSKRSKAVPIVPPTSSNTPPPAAQKEAKEAETQYDRDGRIVDDSRVKRARATPVDGDDDEVLFADPASNDLTVLGTPLHVSGADAEAEAVHEKADDVQEVEALEAVDADETKVDEEVEGEDEDVAAQDTAMSSTVLSESTDAKMPATTSPSEPSPLMPWTPFNFVTQKDVADFNSARPMGDNMSGHRKSLSASAKPFVPSASFRGDSVVSFAAEELKVEEENILPTTEPAEDDDKATQAATPVVAKETFVTFSSPPPTPPPATEKPKPKGLAASRYATSSPPPPPPPPKGHSVVSSPGTPPPVPSKDTVPVFTAEQFVMPVPETDFQDELNAGVGAMDDVAGEVGHEPTYEEIDDIMRHMNEFDESHGVHKVAGAIQPPVNLTAPSPSRPYRHIPYTGEPELPQQPLRSTELDESAEDEAHYKVGRQGHISGFSEWENTFAGEEQLKLESRVNFFDGRVNDIVGGLLAEQLNPLEKSLDRIQHAIAVLTRGTPSSRREFRSNSGEIVESDADDEDDEMPPVPRRSMSPRRDRRIEQMRAVVLDALATHQPLAAAARAPGDDAVTGEAVGAILEMLADVKQHVGKIADKEDEHSPEARIAQLEESLRAEQAKADTEMASRRAADDQVAELRRQLQLAETRVVVEIMNRSAYDQRVADLEDRLKHQDERLEAELSTRQAAEDRLSEVERQLRVATEEEARLREGIEERDDKLKALSKISNDERVRLAVLEASQVNSEQTQGDLQNRVNALEAELREKAQEGRHWRVEAERAMDVSQRQGNDLVQATTELKHVKRVVDTLGTQLEENERLRDAWRSKFVALQDDMARAAREVAEESARFIKREQTLLARHEVLDAKLQAEARTRERLESELERLEGGERQAMRAVSECKRLEALLGELRTENHELQRSAQRTRMALQGELEAAHSQVDMVRSDMEEQLARVRAQADQMKMDADTARARLEMMLEEAETSRQTAMEAAAVAKRTAAEEVRQRHQNELEDVQARLERKLNNTAEDAQRTEQNLLERLSISTSKTEHLQDRVAHLEEQLAIAREAAQAAAKHATETTAKATAKAGGGGHTASAALQPAATVKALHHGLGLPEKISPQALRESIFVLQEQLQQREQRIEELEQTLDKVDPEAEAKIAKRDDEITWLRELLAVRHADLQDIATALSRENHDADRVRDAVIRLQANLQMEQQERERAMNGGSAIKLPALAASLRDIAATPRVAQAVGPLAAAWGSWRKSSLLSGTTPSVPVSAATAAKATPQRRRAAAATAAPSVSSSRVAASSVSSRTSRAGSSAPAARSGAQSGDSSFLSGLMTPPMSSRQAVLAQQQQHQQQHQQQQQQQQQSDEQSDDQPSQPTAFSNTGRRYTGGRQPMARRMSRADKVVVAPSVMDESDSGSVSGTAHDDDDVTPPRPTNRRRQPVTPPMMRQSAYDSDAQLDEFDDPSFYEE